MPSHFAGIPGTDIKKVRNTVIHDGNEWVIDVFKGANKGLTVAEIELNSEDQPFTLSGVDKS